MEKPFLLQLELQTWHLFLLSSPPSNISIRITFPFPHFKFPLPRTPTVQEIHFCRRGWQRKWSYKNQLISLISLGYHHDTVHVLLLVFKLEQRLGILLLVVHDDWLAVLIFTPMTELSSQPKQSKTYQQHSLCPCILVLIVGLATVPPRMEQQLPLWVVTVRPMYRIIEGQYQYGQLLAGRRCNGVCHLMVSRLLEIC